MTETERGLGHRWFEEVWNKLRREAIAELLTPDAVLHESGTDTIGPEGFYPFYDRLRATLSDIHVTVHDTVVEGDKLVIRWSCTGRHTGGGLGVPATGRTIDVTGMSLMRVENGRLAEAWQNWDMLALLEQIHEKAKSATYIGA